MKVVILNNDFRVYWKGRITYLKAFLAERNIDLYAVELFGKGSPYSFEQYNAIYSWWTCLFPSQSADQLSGIEIKRSLFFLLDEIRPDIIIASSIVFFAGALGLRWAKANKAKFIMFDDAKPIQVKRNFLVQYIKDLITAQSDALWLPSKDYDEAYAYFRNKGVYFFYGYDCVNNDQFKFGGTRKLNHNVIICVARLVPIKNIDNLLRAWQIIEERGLNCRLLIIGSGPDRDNLVELANKLALKNAVFLGTVNNDDLPSYFFESDALILPSLSETWGLVVNEAMASGLPVLLSSKVNACGTLLKSGINGFTFEPDDITSMAQAITKYIALDEFSKSEMSDQSLAVIKLMDYENMGRNLVEAIDTLSQHKFRKTDFVPSLILDLWFGRYNTSGWDKL